MNLLRGVTCQVRRSDPFFHVLVVDGLTTGSDRRSTSWGSRVPVLEHAGNELAIALVTERPIEPETIPPNRTTERRVDLPQLLQLVASGEASVPDLLCDVVSLHSSVGASHEQTAAEHVAARTRDDIHLWTTGGRLAEAARQTERDLLRGAYLRHIEGHAHALEPHAQPIDENLSLVAPATMDLEHAEDRP